MSEETPDFMQHARAKFSSTKKTIWIEMWYGPTTFSASIPFTDAEYLRDSLTEALAKRAEEK